MGTMGLLVTRIDGCQTTTLRLPTTQTYAFLVVRYKPLVSLCTHTLEFLIVRVNEVNTTQTSGIAELWFLDCPLLLPFVFRCIGHMFPHLWPKGVWPGGRLFSCQSPPGPHVYPSGGFSLDTVNLVKPVHASDNSRSPSTFQKSSTCFSNDISKDVSVVLVTSMYRSGIGNDSSLGTYSQFDSAFHVMTVNSVA